MSIIKVLLISFILLLPICNYADSTIGIEPLPTPSLNAVIQPLPITIVTPLTIEESNPFWLNFQQFLLDIKPPATINLHINGYGGESLIVESVVNAMKNAESRGIIINGIVDSMAISGHGFMLCAASTIAMIPGSAIVLHSSGTEVQLLNGNITYKQRPTYAIPESMTLNNTLLTNCVKAKVLTAQEVNLINQGERIVIVKDYSGNYFKYILEDYDSGYLNMLMQLTYLVFISCLTIFVIGLIKRV